MHAAMNVSILMHGKYILIESRLRILSFLLQSSDIAVTESKYYQS